MKITKILFAAAILILALALFSCGKDDDGGGLSLLGTKDVKALQDFDGNLVLENRALNLLTDEVFHDGGYIYGGSNPSSKFLACLVDANKDVYNAAVKDKTTYATKSLYFTAEKEEKNNLSPSISVSLKDNDAVLKTKAGVTAASITGSSKSSETSSGSASLTSASYSYGKSNSINKTFAITEGFFTSGSYKVAGIITIEASESSKTTTKTSLTTDYKSESTLKSTVKISAALTISKKDASMTNAEGGKYIISYSIENNSNSRSSNGGGGYIYQDIKVYDNDNALKYTITSSDYNISKFDGIADYFFD